MSVHTTQQQQIQQELQNELTTSNQLLHLISIELQQIKEHTRPSGEMETKVVENASIMQGLGSILQLDLENIPPFPRMTINSYHQGVPNEVNNETTVNDTT